MRPALFVALATVLILPLSAGAQSLGSIASPVVNTSPFTVSVSPQYPAPYGQATLSFISTSLDLANSTVTVSVAGKEIYQGSVHPVSITLGKTGSVTAVAVKIVTNGTTYTQSLTLQPEEVSLVVEPISSAPPLYKGKSSVPLNGNVRIVAMADLKGSDGKVIAPSTYAYSWTVDDAFIASASGIGKNTLLVASPLQYRARTVKVAVMTQDRVLAGGAELTLSALDPTVRIYENDPLLGLRYERAVSGQFNIADAESSLYAAPFSLPTTGGAPFVQWFLNGSPAQKGNSITLRPTGSGQGNASLSLTASTGESLVATANLSLIFGAQPSTNFFGL